MNRLQRLQNRLAPHKAALLDHPVYREADRLESLRLFMERHAFAVWDFMSLLKVLQRQLTCVGVPWLPAADPLACRFVNEIVLAEESDDDGRGGYASHFELYRRAMTRCGANTAPLDGFLKELRRGRPVAAALGAQEVPPCARQFVRQTFAVIEGGDLCALASAFTFGREDLLPAVFQRLVDELDRESGGRLDDFRYYLRRHIGLDGDEHGPMATRLLLSLCADDESRWDSAERAALDCLEARRLLWDGIYDEMRRARGLVTCR